MMNEIVDRIALLSFSAVLPALLILVLKPLIQRKFSKSWYYYIWVIIIIRLILPTGLPVNIIDTGEVSKMDYAAGNIESLYAKSALPEFPAETKELEAPLSLFKVQGIMPILPLR